MPKNEVWWGDLELTKSNLKSMVTPISFDKNEWYPLAAIVHVNEKYNSTRWMDDYLIFCCVSDNEQLNNDGEERYLTIELNEYTENDICTAH